MNVRIVCALLMLAQSAPRPSFDVASVKPSGPDDGLMYRLQPGGRYIVTGVTLKALIANAYGVQDFLVTGAPRWLDSDKYNIEARTGAPLPPWPDSNQQLSLMIRSLMEDRVKLAVHRETLDKPVYELQAASGGAKLTAANPDERAGFEVTPGRIRSMAAPMAILAANLGYVLGRSVVDKTGLTGKYSYTVTYTPDNLAPTDASGPSIFTAVREQLGLRLESARGPVEVLVIDHVEKPPEN